MQLEAWELGITRDQRVLYRDLDLRTEAPAAVVTGPSGSGKSTLLKQLAGLIRGEGELRLNGVSPESMGWPAWRSRVLYVPQTPASLDPTPAEHWQRVASFRARRRPTPVDAVVGIAEGWGIDPTLWRRPWSTLSGGERQRIWLAVAVGLEADVLLLDEPTAALDDATRWAVETALRGREAVWVTHDPAQVERVGGHRVTL